MDSAHPSSPAFALNNRAGTIEETARLRKFLMSGAFLLLCFSLPLYQVMAFALENGLYSYILLIPVISAYLVWISRAGFYPAGIPLPRGWAVTFLTAGLALLLWTGLAYFGDDPVPLVDRLALAMSSLVLLLAGLLLLYGAMISGNFGLLPHNDFTRTLEVLRGAFGGR